MTLFPTRLTSFRWLLQQSHRRVSSARLSRLYLGWYILVRDPLAHGDYHGSFSPCARVGKCQTVTLPIVGERNSRNTDGACRTLYSLPTRTACRATMYLQVSCFPTQLWLSSAKAERSQPCSSSLWLLLPRFPPSLLLCRRSAPMICKFLAVATPSIRRVFWVFWYKKLTCEQLPHILQA